MALTFGQATFWLAQQRPRRAGDWTASSCLVATHASKSAVPCQSSTKLRIPVPNFNAGLYLREHSIHYIIVVDPIARPPISRSSLRQLRPQTTARMISDNDLYTLAIFLGSAAMLLIIVYHFLEVNSTKTPVTGAKVKST
ncbi:hypothetical protein NHJ6243_003401 [Beauveria neobassiana]